MRYLVPIVLSIALLGCQQTAQTARDQPQPQTQQAVASSQTETTGSRTDEASKYATASEIRAALDGKCVKGTRWEECYDGSKLVYTEHNVTRGTWSIADNPNGAVVTFNYPRWGTVQRYIGIDGATVTYYKMDGSVRATATILEGS